ncbi:TPA: hypothetical protein GXZ34_04360 [bacterium]|nr:hypothetical protein [bacterium]
MFCRKCGGKLETYGKNCPFCGTPTGEKFGVTYESNGPRSYTSVAKWFFMPLLMAIPIVNIVLLIFWSFGDRKKDDPTFRNWALAQLLFILVALVAIVIVIFVVAYGVVNLQEINNNYF